MRSFLEGSDTFSGPFPPSGTMLNGRCYERATFEIDPGVGHLSAELDSSCWPTACATDGSKAPERYPGGNPSLPAAAKMWPTPTAEQYGSSQNGINGVGGEFERPSAGTPSLAKLATMGMWQTPTTSVATGGNANRGGDRSDELLLEGQARQWPTPNVPNGGRTMRPEDIEAKGSTAKGKRQVGLENVAKQWPTPTASANSNRTTHHQPSVLEGRHGRTLAGEAGSWPTPTSSDAKASGAAGYSSAGHHAGVTLTDAVLGARGQSPTKPTATGQRVLWATPRRSDGDKGGPNSRDGSGSLHLSSQAVRVSGSDPTTWSTPTVNDAKNNAAPSQKRRNSAALNVQASMSGLPDPETSEDGASTSNAIPKEPPPSLVLSPVFVEALQGFPTGWTDSGASAIPFYPRRPSTSQGASPRPLPRWRLNLVGAPSREP